MGVPFISYAAPTPAGSGGASILAAAGLKQLITNSVEGYIDLAVDLAINKDQLAVIRTDLRQRTAASPLADGVRYTRALENHFTATVTAADLTLGTYYLGAIADPTNGQPESVETNNALTGATLTIRP